MNDFLINNEVEDFLNAVESDTLTVYKTDDFIKFVKLNNVNLHNYCFFEKVLSSNFNEELLYLIESLNISDDDFEKIDIYNYDFLRNNRYLSLLENLDSFLSDDFKSSLESLSVNNNLELENLKLIYYIVSNSQSNIYKENIVSYLNKTNGKYDDTLINFSVSLVKEINNYGNYYLKDKDKYKQLLNNFGDYFIKKIKNNKIVVHKDNVNGLLNIFEFLGWQVNSSLFNKVDKYFLDFFKNNKEKINDIVLANYMLLCLKNNKAYNLFDDNIRESVNNNKIFEKGNLKLFLEYAKFKNNIYSMDYYKDMFSSYLYLVKDEKFLNEIAENENIVTYEISNLTSCVNNFNEEEKERYSTLFVNLLLRCNNKAYYLNKLDQNLLFQKIDNYPQISKEIDKLSSRAKKEEVKSFFSKIKIYNEIGNEDINKIKVSKKRKM